MPVTNVHLCDLRAGASAGIAHIEGHRHWQITRGGRNRQVVVGKSSVGKSIAERE